ncbi:MAG: hypothetical protein JSW71_05950, partial [Gemmatimonadota bacterium]
DTGVNVITMLVDGYQVALEEGSSLRYEWDTTVYIDGERTVTFVVRDNGGTVGQCSLEVTVDNSNEHDPPVLSLTGFDAYVTGVHTLRVRAEDASVIAVISVEFSHRLMDHKGEDAGPGTEDFEIRQSNISDIEYEWNTALCPDRSYDVVVSAEDAHGNRTRMLPIRMHTANHARVVGRVRAANSMQVGGALVCALQPGFHGDYSLLPDQEGCLAYAVANFKGEFELPNTPFGHVEMYVRRDSREYMFDVHVPVLLKGWRVHDVGDSAIVPGIHPPGMSGQRDIASSTRVGVVSGDHDNIVEFFGEMSEGGWLGANLGGWTAYDGNDSLGEDAVDFCDLLREEVTRQRLWSELSTLIIDSGNHYEELILSEPELGEALRNWVLDGGRLVVIGQSYDFVEQLWPEKIDFAGDGGINGLGAVPEELNAAQVGPAWLDDAPPQSASVMCLLHEPARWWYHEDLRPSFPGSLMWSWKLAGYDEEHQTIPVPICGFREDWPVIERISDDAVTWLTLLEPPTPDVVVGKPVQASFESGLGDVFMLSHLLCSGSTGLNIQIYVSLSSHRKGYY